MYSATVGSLCYSVEIRKQRERWMVFEAKETINPTMNEEVVGIHTFT